MAKITTDLAALDSAATTVTKVSDILTHWGYTPGSYTTWGDARTDANQLLTGTALGTIANGEVGTTFVPKLNFLNDTAEVSKYGGAFVNGFRPEFGAFFDLDAYSVDNTPSTFSGAITHTRASTATYVDSNGVLKWAPHNLLVRSEEFDNASWLKSNLTVTANAAVAPDGATTADKIVATANNGSIRQTFTAPTVANTSQIFSLVDGSEGSVIAGSWDQKAVTHVGDGWWRIQVTKATITYVVYAKAAEWSYVTIQTLSGPSLYIYPAESSSSTGTADGTSGIYVWGAHVYRSDLGGMGEVPVADRVAGSTTYVPTTTAAVHCPRVGHHVWNGSAWVNEGLLHESEARTNLLTYSEDLSNAAWIKSIGTTIGTPVTRKGISLDLIQSDGVTNFDSVFQSFGSVSNGAYATFSLFIEAGSSVETAIRIDDTGAAATSNRCTVPITWTSGVPTLLGDQTAGITFVSASIQDYADGLYRVNLTIQNNTGGALNLYAIYYVQFDDPAAAVNTYAGGFQAEVGPTPSSYIPTSGSTVTRASDVLTIPSANLPWPEPEYIGPELVTNGGFDTDSDWTKGAGWTISGGKAIATSVTGAGAISQPITRTAGSVYKITVDVSNSSGSYSLNINGAGTGAILTGDGTKTVYTVATTTGSIDLQIQQRTGTALSGEFDNISVREINPLAVSIQMDGRVTYADLNNDNQGLFYDWGTFTTNGLRARLSTGAGGTGGLQVLQAASSVIDTVISINSYTPGILVPFNIASRHGSTFVNGAVDGTALTADTTPVALPDLSATNLTLGQTYMGTIKTFRVWANDIGDAGIAGASA